MQCDQRLVVAGGSFRELIGIVRGRVPEENHSRNEKRAAPSQIRRACFDMNLLHETGQEIQNIGIWRTGIAYP